MIDEVVCCSMTAGASASIQGQIIMANLLPMRKIDKQALHTAHSARTDIH
jgi:hypothetical protein